MGIRKSDSIPSLLFAPPLLFSQIWFQFLLGFLTHLEKERNIIIYENLYAPLLQQLDIIQVVQIKSTII